MSMVDIESTDVVASKFDSLLSQACQRVFDFREARQKPHTVKAKWYDKECVELRSKAVKAGERVESSHDKQMLADACKKYRACKQRKKRKFKQNSLNEVEQIMKTNPSELYNLTNELNKCGFDNWYGKAWDLMKSYDTSENVNLEHFRKNSPKNFEIKISSKLV